MPEIIDLALEGIRDQSQRSWTRLALSRLEIPDRPRRDPGSFAEPGSELPAPALPGAFELPDTLFFWLFLSPLPPAGAAARSSASATKIPLFERTVNIVCIVSYTKLHLPQLQETRGQRRCFPRRWPAFHRGVVFSGSDHA